MKKITILTFLTMVGIFLAGSVQGQTYKIFKGDTINRTDAKGLKQGTWKRFYDNDKPFSVAFYKNGIAQGTTITYYKSGEKQGDLIHDKDGKTARLVSYWPSGKIKATGKYVSQKKDSLWNYFNEKEILTSVESFKSGEAHGVWKVFYTDGRIAEEYTWVGGKKQGPFKKYFQSGSVKASGTYKNDSLEGTIIYFYEDGKPYVKGDYSKGLMHGKWLYMNSRGVVDSTHSYSEGIKQ